jgi:hypothetical protein
MAKLSRMADLNYRTVQTIFHNPPHPHINGVTDASEAWERRQWSHKIYLPLVLFPPLASFLVYHMIVTYTLEKLFI